MYKFNPDGTLISETIKEYRCVKCGSTETYIYQKSQKPAWYFQRNEEGIVTGVYCLSCKNHGYRQSNLEAYKTYMNGYRARPDVIARRRERTVTPEYREKKRAYYHRPEVNQRIRQYYKSDYQRKQKAKHQTAVRLRKKQRVVAHYSKGTNACACCGENRSIKFLNLDHVNGGGNKHRKVVGSAGSSFYAWIIHNNYPEGFQILCWNCNMAKGQWGECPHKTGAF